jgi:5-hydroxyisourate hydrolase
MGLLTTHVLDTTQGKPASALRLTIWAITADADIKTALKTVETNSDGRTDEPLLSRDEFQPGTYEITFDVAAILLALAQRFLIPLF